MSVPLLLAGFWLFIPLTTFLGLFSAYSGPRISKQHAIVIGLGLVASSCIAFFGLTGIVQPFAEFLARPEAPDGARLSVKDVSQISSFIQLMLWMLPFVSASLGTNLISDALTRGVRYGKRRKAKDRLQRWFLRVSLEQLNFEKAQRAQAQIFSQSGSVARLNAAACAKRAKRRGIRARRLMRH